MKPKRKAMLDNELFTPRTTNDKYPDEKRITCPECLTENLIRDGYSKDSVRCTACGHRSSSQDGG